MEKVMKRINGGRQIELDLARGLAVIFMVLVHVMIVFADDGVYETLYGQVTDVVGGVPAAPVFMFLLGTGLIFSRKTSAVLYLQRGAMLFFGGYLLNFLRSVIPEMILIFQDRSSAELPFWQNIYYSLLNVDILQFAGLAFFFFALIRYLKLNIKMVIVIGVVFAILNTVLPHTNAQTATLWAPITSLFIGGNEGLSYFPFITWIAYPIAGYVFGYFLIQAEDKKQFYKRIFTVTGLILGLYSFGVVLLKLPTGYESEVGYYFHNGMMNSVYVCFVLFWISMLYFLSPYVQGVIRRVLETSSQYVSQIYFIHWVVIGVATLFIDRESSALFALLLLTCIIFGMSYYSAKGYVNLRSKMRRK